MNLTEAIVLPMRKSRARRLVGLLLFLTAAWLLLSGSYSLGKAQLAQYLLEHSWQTLQGENEFREIKPWSGADTFPIAKMRIERLGWSAVVLHGVTGEALAFGPGHIPSSANPGSRGNSVIAGHRDTHFRVLEKLHLGDVVAIERAKGTVIEFRINDIRIVDETEVSVLASGEITELTLITCYPFDAITSGGPLRYVVTANAIIETSGRHTLPSPISAEPRKHSKAI